MCFTRLLKLLVFRLTSVQIEDWKRFFFRTKALILKQQNEQKILIINNMLHINLNIPILHIIIHKKKHFWRCTNIFKVVDNNLLTINYQIQDGAECLPHDSVHSTNHQMSSSQLFKKEPSLTEPRCISFFFSFLCVLNFD